MELFLHGTTRHLLSSCHVASMKATTNVPGATARQFSSLSFFPPFPLSSFVNIVVALALAYHMVLYIAFELMDPQNQYNEPKPLGKYSKRDMQTLTDE